MSISHPKGDREFGGEGRSGGARVYGGMGGGQAVKKKTCFYSLLSTTCRKTMNKIEKKISITAVDHLPKTANNIQKK